MSANSVMEHKTLHCLYLPGTHNHTAIANVLKACIEGYHIDLNSNVTAFTTVAFFIRPAVEIDIQRLVHQGVL